MKSWWLASLVVVGCGSSAGGGGVDAPPGGSDGAPPGADASVPPPGRYAPWHAGAVWTYRVSDPTGMVAAHVAKTTMGAVENMPSWAGVNAGRPAYKMHEEKLVGSLDAWEGFEGDLDVRYAQVDFDAQGAMVDQQYAAPYRLKLDEAAAHVAAAAAYSETFNETTITAMGTTTNPKAEAWKVINPAEPVTVMAGSFTALHVRRTNGAGGTAKTKDYWFVKDIGKVKETGGSQDEELISYTP